ncbi:MAG: GNAT family N-acetyltransferase [Parabacteroides sp.]
MIDQEDNQGNLLETERLFIRYITDEDFDVMFAIMSKREVMYAWEHGFSKEDVSDWIERQFTRYAKDGIGYFAMIEKESGRLIGQAGLMRTVMHGKEVVELGYILDDAYWHNGYAIEAAGHLLNYAHRNLGFHAVYCSIRPENKASLRVVEKLGMKPCGSHVVVYRGKEMLHLIYKSMITR